MHNVEAAAAPINKSHTRDRKATQNRTQFSSKETCPASAVQLEAGYQNTMPQRMCQLNQQLAGKLPSPTKRIERSPPPPLPPPPAPQCLLADFSALCRSSSYSSSTWVKMAWREGVCVPQC